MRPNKSQSILAVGQQLTQTLGYNAFSYADISERVHIRKASIHYYFPSKEDLGRKLVVRYRRVMRYQLRVIEQTTSNPPDRLAQLLRLYQAELEAGGLGLCTMLSAEYLTLPESVQAQVHEFYAELEQWVTQVIESGQAAGQFRLGDAAMTARSWLAALQGAQMRCRIAPDGVSQWDAIAAHLLQQLATE